jgi:hypothetical protein
MNSKWIMILGVFVGFLGGVASNGIFAEAQSGSSQVVSAQTFQLVDNKGKMTGSWTSCTGGSPCLNLFDAQGKVRLQLGLYSAAGEAGLPFVILNNERQEPKAILRLFGNNAAPVLVLKNNNQDKMIMGLDFQNSEEPFLVRYDNVGGKNMVFGNY